tara:strand:- start:897 stop:2036 length:1140 start_codon:yes stop_codon:yes gene_type:complete
VALESGLVRVIVAPDSLKGTVSARDAARAIAAGWRELRTQDTVTLKPMADGGEGTLDAVETSHPGAVRHAAVVRGPQMREVHAEWLMLDDGTAVVEMAQSSGLPLVDELDPMGSHTFGVGELIAAALDAGADRLIVGLGGSASTDGGAGALAALGARFLDSAGRPVPLGGGGLAELDRIVLDDLRPAPPRGVVCLSDVTAPLRGAHGAAAVFGPQKGATAVQVRELDRSLARLAALLGDSGNEAGDGAAGGTSFGLRAAWGAQLRPGADQLAALTGLTDELSEGDVLITGEERFDRTSLQGKVVGHLLELAQSYGATVCIVAGQAEDPRSNPDSRGLVTLTELAGGSANAIAEPERWLRAAGAELAAREPWEPRRTEWL